MFQFSGGVGLLPAQSRRQFSGAPPKRRSVGREQSDREADSPKKSQTNQALPGIPSTGASKPTRSSQEPRLRWTGYDRFCLQAMQPLDLVKEC